MELPACFLHKPIVIQGNSNGVANTTSTPIEWEDDGGREATNG